MLDSGSDRTYMKTSIANKLKLYIIPKNKTVKLADDNTSATIRVDVVINLKFNSTIHESIVLELIDDLCVEILVGKDVMMKHKKIILNFNGSKEELVVGATSNKNEN